VPRTRSATLQSAEPTLDRAALVLRHRPLVSVVARAYAGRGLDVDDLVQEGMCGLLAAADRYDPGRGVKFWTYARYWVRDAIQRAVLRHSRLIYVPAYLVREIDHVVARLCATLGRFPRLTELADAVGIDPALCARVLQALETPASLNASAGQDGAPLSEAVADPGARNPEALVVETETREDLRRLLDRLSTRERVILESRCGFDGECSTFEELAKRQGLSSARVRQIYRASLIRLRNATHGSWMRELN
jgi:RNA polymerase sigma factor (sigma-70 family)